MPLVSFCTRAPDEHTSRRSNPRDSKRNPSSHRSQPNVHRPGVKSACATTTTTPMTAHGGGSTPTCVVRTSLVVSCCQGGLDIPGLDYLAARSPEGNNRPGKAMMTSRRGTPSSPSRQGGRMKWTRDAFHLRTPLSQGNGGREINPHPTAKRLLSQGFPRT